MGLPCLCRSKLFIYFVDGISSSKVSFVFTLSLSQIDHVFCRISGHHRSHLSSHFPPCSFHISGQSKGLVTFEILSDTHHPGRVKNRAFGKKRLATCDLRPLAKCK